MQLGVIVPCWTQKPTCFTVDSIFVYDLVTVGGKASTTIILTKFAPIDSGPAL